MIRPELAAYLGRHTYWYVFAIDPEDGKYKCLCCTTSNDAALSLNGECFEYYGATWLCYPLEATGSLLDAVRQSGWKLRIHPVDKIIAEKNQILAEIITWIEENDTTTEVV